MNLPFWSKKILLFYISILVCCVCSANDNLFRQARSLQRDGKFDEAIVAFKEYLSQPQDENGLTSEQLNMYTDALVQLMNTYQSKGEPDACISALQEVFYVSPTLQNECLRDFYSVLGYALSRTERMKEAEETMLKVFGLPLNHSTPQRYFRDYAYAAAVFYSNPHYQKEVVKWCQEALLQAQVCKNTSGKQWVTAMLGSIYKRNGHLNKALELFQESKEEAKLRNDDLGVLNSLHTLTDLLLFWNIPEYANVYASEAIEVEKNMTVKNPMVSAQTFINKGRALYQLGETDSVSFYTRQARKLCQSLPYNSGMVDVHLLQGTFLTNKGGDSLYTGIQDLEQVTLQGTAANRAKAYHQLAQTYLKQNNTGLAEKMLDSMYSLVEQTDSPVYIHIDYEPILDYYLENKNADKVEQYVRLMLQGEQVFNEKKLNFNLVETIVELQTQQKNQDLKIEKLGQANQWLMLLWYITISVIIILVVCMLFIYQRKKHAKQMKQADEKLSSLIQELDQTNAEKEIRAQEIKEILQEKDNHQELVTLTPNMLKTEGETKFRQCFEVLHPLFLTRLRERVPSITRREELISMLIVLKQDNRKIAELLSIAPRSVLMLRHRYRQKIGLETGFSLEDFMEEILGNN